MSSIKELEEIIKKSVQEEIEKIKPSLLKESIDELIESRLKSMWDTHLEALKSGLMSDFIAEWEEQIQERAEHWDNWVKELRKSYRKFGQEYFTLFCRMIDIKVKDVNLLLVETEKMKDLFEEHLRK